MKKQIEKEAISLDDYVMVEKLVHGKIIKVKVFISQADKYIKSWRTRREAAPTIKQKH